MQKFNGSLIRQFPSLTTGNAASGVQVSVFISGTNTLATLYATNNTAGAQLSNPLTTDSKGFYSFYAADGRYRLQFNNGYPSLEEQLVDVIDINAQADAAIANIDAALVGLENTVDTLTLVVAGDFETGTTVTARNQVVLWPISAGGDGREYRWAGALPKTVPAASTPAGTGGISDSAWVYTADVALEQALADGTADVKLKSGQIFGSSGAGSITISPSGRVGIGENTPASLLAVKVENNATAGIRCRSEWTGSTALPYQNNDNCLFETYNNVESDSVNLSWSVSAPNAYNNIPAGVADDGGRTGVYGWTASITVPGEYVHAGTLDRQFGVWGRAGFQGGGVNASPAGAVVRKAVAVRGDIRSDSPGTTIIDARGGEFICTGYESGTVENNYGVYSLAEAGFLFNYSLYGAAGNLYNRDKAFFGSAESAGGFFGESASSVSSRRTGNSFEFGFPEAGYGCNIGANPIGGRPFIAFSAEVDSGADTYRTRGSVGNLITTDLAGTLLFSVLTNPNSSGQSPTVAMSLWPSGTAEFEGGGIFKNRLRLATGFVPSASSDNGNAGEIAWDSDYIYLCIAANTWKRVAIATW